MVILHIITGLEDGGAEGVLFRLCVHSCRYNHVVISLTGDGKYGPLMRAEGVKVHSLNIKNNQIPFIAFLKLIYLLRHYRPDVVQTWMYHADLFGGIAARISGIKSIVWGIRHSTLVKGKSKTRTILISRFLAYLSWFVPFRIAVCAQFAMSVHGTLGYNTAVMRFLPNGYNLKQFSPNPELRSMLRTELGLGSSERLVGTVGRYNPQKDHANLLEALYHLRSRNFPLRCALVGANLDNDNQELKEAIQHFGLEDTVILMGSRTDIPAIMNALDVHILPSSFGEGFPNVVAEAMACGTPCVVTDTGDATYIVEDTGWVVPPSDAESLANAIHDALTMSESTEWQERCVLARKRVETNFSVQQMVDAYSQLWEETKRLQ